MKLAGGEGEGGGCVEFWQRWDEKVEKVVESGRGWDAKGVAWWMGRGEG